MKKLITNWYLLIVFGFIVFAGLVFILSGEDSIIAVHDNLDLFIPQFQMMKDTGTFWTHGEWVPFLGGISRDSLPAEFSLYTMLYMILPAYWAYIAGYFLKILIALGSVILLAKELYGEQYSKYKPLVYLLGLAYGILNLFPAFGIPFASIPLVIWLVLKIYRQPAAKWYVALFFYPLLSYFTYFGLFILAYMVVAFIWLWIRDKKIPWRNLLAIVVLSAGCIACEYRLFGLMLFGDEVTIRSTMVAGSMSAVEIIRTIGDVLTKGMFHAESMHTWLILPVCIFYFIYLNVSYIRHKNLKGIFHDLFNLMALVLVFNSVIYGIYYWEGFRQVVETICPPLTGWQFNRTVFFSPFVWYAAFFLVLKRLYDNGRKLLTVAANLLAVASILLIVLSDTTFNDLYHTCFGQAYSIVKDKQVDQLSYGEFYSEELFEEAKEDIGYCGQWSAAYGFYPAILEYNGIATLDGYLGFYSQIYKDEFRKVIAPALNRVEESRIYYDEWGARAYLYSGTDLSIVNAYRSYNVTDNDIYIDLDAFKALGGRYIFSRIELSNAQETGLELVGTYTNDSSPYTLYVYQTTSFYQTRKKADVSFSEMNDLTYDKTVITGLLEQMETLAADAVATGEQADPELMINLYTKVTDELSILSTCYSLASIQYYQDIYSEENTLKEQELLEMCITIQDHAYGTLRQVCQSPYRETMKTVMDPYLVESMAKYEDKTERELEIEAEENKLTREFEQAAGEDFIFEYQGKEWNSADLDMVGMTLEPSDYIAIYQGIGQKRTDALGTIFLELVTLRNEMAQISGYDNYAEYAYSELYVRDYSYEDVKKLFQMIKKDIVPVISDMETELREMDLTPLYTIPVLEDEEMYAAILPYMNEIDPELGASLSHLMEYEMYDIAFSDVKANVGFTIDLPYYQDAFIFASPTGDYRDYHTAIHEFGHYNQTYRSTESILETNMNMDVAEIHSQGLELLFYEYYDDLAAGEAGEQLAFAQIFQLAQAVVDVAQISEFEIEVYENPDMTIQEMNELYLELSEEYGIYYVPEITQLYDWSNVNHLFSDPCYYVSYLTSALSSLDLFTISVEDPHKAVELYMQLTALPTYVPYCSAVEYVGLQDIFEKGTAADIMNKTAAVIMQ